jgi:AraC-like DNA-binding protein
MYILIATLQAISSILGFIVGLILLLANKNRGVNTILLALLVFLFSFQTISNLFFYTKWILLIPWMHRYFSPFSLLAYPIAYLYCRNTARNVAVFYKQDWLWFFPTLCFIIIYSPYYILPSVFKKAHLELQYSQNGFIEDIKEGFFNRAVFSFFRVGWFCFCLYLSHFEIKKSLDKKIGNYQLRNNWLKLLIGWLGFLMAISVPLITISSLWRTNLAIADLAVSLTIFVLCAKLFFKPEILYGVEYENTILSSQKLKVFTQLVSKIEINNNDIVNQISNTFENNTTEYTRIRKQIDTYFLTDKPYLNPNFNLEDLVKAISIPRYLVSATINKEMGIGFREYLNICRIEYLLRNIDSPEWKNLTMEAIAKESGFKSRFTFTPSEYLKIKKNS